MGGSFEQLIDYVLNNPGAWSFPELPAEGPEDAERARRAWDGYVASLDTAILSLLGESEVPDDEIATALDAILQSSLWERRLNRRSAEVAAVLKAGLVARSQHIWAQSTPARRRGYFLAGVGLGTGHALDAVAAEVNALLVAANGALLQNDTEGAIAAITAIAEKAFAIYPFTPDKIPGNWRDTLRSWLLGEPLANVSAGQEADTLQFVEGGLVYRLPWAMEAIRVRGVANGDLVGGMGLSLAHFELTLAVSAVETGTLNRSASILIQAGFNSRTAAIKAANDTGATFATALELQQWLSSDAVTALGALPDWPTAETKAMWSTFVHGFAPRSASTWKKQRYWAAIAWQPGRVLPANTPLRLHHLDDRPVVLSADGQLVAYLDAALNPARQGLVRAEAMSEPGKIDVTYFGPDDLWLA